MINSCLCRESIVLILFLFYRWEGKLQNLHELNIKLSINNCCEVTFWLKITKDLIKQQICNFCKQKGVYIIKYENKFKFVLLLIGGINFRI